MTLHGIALFVHVVLAIGLVGGSVWAGVAGHRLRRATTVDAARAHVEAMRAFDRAAVPLGVGTFLAGAWLATVGGAWTRPWLVASLVLFLVVGALTTTVVGPATTAVAEALDESPGGPMPPDAVLLAHAPGVALVPSLFAGIDLAIVFLMTNKPGLAVTIGVAATGIVLGTAVGLLTMRQPAYHTA